MKECRNIYSKRLHSTDYLRLNLTGRHLWDNLIVVCADDEGFLKYDTEIITMDCFPRLSVTPETTGDQLQEMFSTGMLKAKNGIIWIVNFLDYQKYEIITPSRLKKTYNPELPTLRPAKNRPKDRIPAEILEILKTELTYEKINIDLQPYFINYQPLINGISTVNKRKSTAEVKRSEVKRSEVKRSKTITDSSESVGLVLKSIFEQFAKLYLDSFGSPPVNNYPKETKLLKTLLANNSQELIVSRIKQMFQFKPTDKETPYTLKSGYSISALYNSWNFLTEYSKKFETKGE